MRSWALRLVSVVVLVALVGGRVHAAENQKIAPMKLDLDALDRAYKKARAKRNIGIALAAPGVTSTILGGILLAYALKIEPAIFSEIVEGVAGAFTAVAGAALAIPGLTLWMLAQDDMDVVTWRKRQLITPFAAARSGSGVAGVTIIF
jgi:hypothetical protein